MIYLLKPEKYFQSRKHVRLPLENSGNGHIIQPFLIQFVASVKHSMQIAQQPHAWHCEVSFLCSPRPKQKTCASYFCPMSPYLAPKPAYSIRYWKERGFHPEPVDVLSVIKLRAERYYGSLSNITGHVRLADSRSADALKPDKPETRFNWVITSPPYYGMRTYIPDQWLRNWFLGGSDTVDYNNHNQIVHSSPEDYISNLRKVWCNTAAVCSDKASLIIRFGGISDRSANPLYLIKNSLKNSGWRITTIRDAGSASEGKRQAILFNAIKLTNGRV